MASIIFKWKKFGTTKTRAGCLSKLSNQGRRALVREVTKNPMVREVTKNPMVTMTELQSLSVEMGEPSRRTPTSVALHQSGHCGCGQTEATPQQKALDTCLEFAKKAPKVLSDNEKQDSLV